MYLCAHNVTSICLQFSFQGLSLYQLLFIMSSGIWKQRWACEMSNSLHELTKYRHTSDMIRSLHRVWNEQNCMTFNVCIDSEFKTFLITV